MKLAVFAVACAAPLVAGTIEGRVTNAVTGEGVSGASVDFLDRGSHPFRTTTDSTGAYRLTGLADGDYRGEFSKRGFSGYRGGASMADIFTGSGGVRVSGDVPVHFDGEMQPWAQCAGE